MSRKSNVPAIQSEPVGLDLELLPRKKKRRPKIAPAVRAAVYERDGYRCVNCGVNRQLTVDHVVPLSKGGKNRISNMVTLCRPCNFDKADGTALYRPVRPVRPLKPPS